MDVSDVQALQDALVSHAMALGVFERVNGHEPKSSPGSGLTASVFFSGPIRPARTSGLASTSLVLTARVRIYAPMLQEPADAIDPMVVGAVTSFMAAVSADFSLDGLVRNVDLLGYEGAPMDGQPGYLNQDNKIFRVGDITVAMIVNDVFDQAA
jgi:hypothetical protein